MRAVRLPIGIAVFLLANLAICRVPGAVQDRVEDLQAQFDRETNPVRKAKLLHKVGDAQFREAKRSADGDDYEAVQKWMERYRDNAKVALAALKVFHPDGERHSEGYRQMQIHVRKSLRALEDIILSTPETYRERLEAVRKDLIGVEDELIKALFPRGPGKTPMKDSEKAEEKKQPLE